MDEKMRQALKGRIVSILYEAGTSQVGREKLTSRIAREKIANDILKAIKEEEGSFVIDLDRVPEATG